MEARPWGRCAVAMFLVLDNSVLSNFALVGRVDLLPRLWPGRLVTAPAAWDELRRGIELGRVPVGEWSWLQVLELTLDEETACGEWVPPLDIGESACLAMAHARGYGFLTDDRVARREARRLGVPLSGTIGVLRSLVDAGSVSLGEANATLQRMIGAGYRVPVDVL